MTQLALVPRARASIIPAYQPPTSLAAFMANKAREAEVAAEMVPASGLYSVPPLRPLETYEVLALLRADTKASARQFAMLFDPEWLAGLSRQIDALLDPEEWVEGDALPSMDSYRTLLVVLMTLRRYRRPGLGLTPNGNFVATWSHSATDRLIVECQPTGRARWIATAPMPAGNESGSHDTTPDRLMLTLDRFNPERWLAAP